jgi:hypothetical protein
MVHVAVRTLGNEVMNATQFDDVNVSEFPAKSFREFARSCAVNPKK